MARRFYWLLYATVGIISVAMVANIERPSSPPEAGQPPMIWSAASLRLGSLFTPMSAGAMMAAREKLFERAGVKVELRISQRASEPIQSVVRGDDTFGVTRADRFLQARANAAPIVAFAAGLIESPTEFLVLTKSGLRTPWDFVGRRVGRRAEDDTAIVYDALTAKLGLPRSKIVEVPVAADLSPFLERGVDVWPGHAGDEGYLLRSAGADYEAIVPAQYGVHLMGTVYFTSEQVVAERPQVVQHFLNGLIAGWNLVYQDYSVSVPAIVSFDSDRLRPEYVRYALERQREYLRPPEFRYGEFTEIQWRSLQVVLLSQRRLERPANLADAITYEFIREAYRKPLTFGQ
jgi:ABC-type nitrate/sulfonate/bicarbonate transport system substrate-binding protein